MLVIAAAISAILSGCPFDIEAVATSQTDGGVPDGAAAGGGGGAGPDAGGGFPGGTSGATGSDAAGATGGGGGVTLDATSPPDAASCTGCGASACRCAPEPEPAWIPAVVAETQDGSTPPCPPGFDMAESVGLGAVDTGCTPCSCSQPATDPCQFHITGNSACDLEHPFGSSPANVGSCRDISFASNVEHASISVDLRTGESCGSASTQPVPPRFETTATVCVRSTPPSCSGGVCVPVPEAPFAPAACVYSTLDGNRSCPQGYPVKFLYSEVLDDSRTCSGCTCELDRFCTGTDVEYCSGSGCSGACQRVASDTCFQTDAASFRVLAIPMPPAQVCKVTGSPSTLGSVTPAGLRVVCCT